MHEPAHPTARALILHIISLRLPRHTGPVGKTSPTPVLERCFHPSSLADPHRELLKYKFKYVSLKNCTF